MDNIEQQEVPDFFSPLDEPMKQRSYSKPESIDTGEIEEPTFAGGLSMEDLESPQEEFQEESKPFDNITNDGVNQLEGKDKKIACKQLVETTLEVYKMGHTFAQRMAKKDEGEIVKAVQDGEIDPQMEIPVDEKGTTTNAVEFFQNYNEQVEEALSYDEEFGEKVRPAMERVFEKRGWGMNDEQYLMYMFGKDIAMKGAMVISLKKQANMIFNTITNICVHIWIVIIRTYRAVDGVMCFKRATFISFPCPGETWKDVFLVNSYVPYLLTLLCAPQCLCTNKTHTIAPLRSRFVRAMIQNLA